MSDTPLKLGIELTVKGDNLTIDFSQSSEACAGPVNISRATTIAATYVALKHIFTQMQVNVEFIISPDS